ncbi:MAG: hypothetical protein ACO1RX_20250 [Candidatus Sericytochromatia bacterium]
MTFSTWGQLPSHTTIVLGNPEPTISYFFVEAVGNLRVGQFLFVKVDDQPVQTAITGISGNQIFVSPPLLGGPDVPGEVVCYSQDITNSKLNQQAVWDSPDLDDLAGTDETNMPYGTRAQVPNLGVYRWQTGQSLPAGRPYVVNGTLGQWVQETMAPAAIAYAIEAALGPLQQHIEAQSKQISSLKSLAAHSLETYIGIAEVELGSISADSHVDYLITLPDDVFPALRDTDFISVNPQFPMVSGLVQAGVWVAGADSIELRLYNYTTSTITPGYMPLILKMERTHR